MAGARVVHCTADNVFIRRLAMELVSDDREYDRARVPSDESRTPGVVHVRGGAVVQQTRPVLHARIGDSVEL